LASDTSELDYDGIVATVIFLKALHLSESGIFTRSHSPKATSSPISVALLIARGLSGSTERMNVES